MPQRNINTNTCLNIKKFGMINFNENVMSEPLTYCSLYKYVNDIVEEKINSLEFKDCIIHLSIKVNDVKKALTIYNYKFDIQEELSRKFRLPVTISLE